MDWGFYEALVDSIPDGSNIHVDYDGRDLEIMAKGPKHEIINRRADIVVGIVAREWVIPFAGMRESTWKRQQIARGPRALVFEFQVLGRGPVGHRTATASAACRSRASG